MLKLTVISLGNKMPDWVVQGSTDYAKRFNDGVSFKIIEIPLIPRKKTSDLCRILEKEAALIKQSIPTNCHVIALESTGQSFTSEQLADKISQLQQTTSHLCFLIGGPEGLATELVQQAQERWSLSQLTLPHPLVRIFLTESLYRACCILKNHPYHK